MQVLYTSHDIRQQIQNVLGEPQRGDRRVVLVAYLGSGAEGLLPHPEGMELICCPEPGATDPNTIRSLQKRGATVRFSERLHMKVYWSSSRGCVITSANASSNAFSRNGLREAGVFLRSGQVDIDRLIRQVQPIRMVSAATLRRLDIPRIVRRPSLRQTTGQDPTPDFLTWYDVPAANRRRWKLGWFVDEPVKPAKATLAKARAEFGVREPVDWGSVSRGSVSEGDWLLFFLLDGDRATGVSWMPVHFVVPVMRGERGAYEADYPYQAVQLFSTRYYGYPPFRITPTFRRAFRGAVAQWGGERLRNRASLIPPESLLRKIAQLLGPTPPLT